MKQTKVVKKENKVIKAAVLAGIVLASAGVGAIAHGLMAEPVIVEKPVEKIVNQTVEVQVPVEVIKTVEVPVEVTVEKLVDNGNLQLVLDELYDSEGSVEYLTEDLDENEVSQIVDRLVFKTESEALAEALVKQTVVEYIDDEENIFKTGDLEDFSDKDVYSVTVDSDDTEFEAVDFDDKEATVFVEAKLRMDNDDDKKTVYVIAEVEVEGDKVEIVKVELKE